MRRTISIGIILAGLLLAACSGSSPGSSSPGSAPGNGGSGGGAAGGGAGGAGGGSTVAHPTASLSVADPSGSIGPFAIADLEKLVLTIDATHFTPGQHAVRVDVTSPGGTLYAQLPAALVVSQDGLGRTTIALQVRGSVIESFQQAGSWQLVANLDGAPLAAASVDFQE